MPSVARRRNRSHSSQRDRLSRRNSCAIIAGPRLSRHDASRRIPKVRSCPICNGHRQAILNPPRPRRRHPPRRNEALHSRPEESRSLRLTQLHFTFSIASHLTVCHRHRWVMRMSATTGSRTALRAVSVCSHMSRGQAHERRYAHRSSPLTEILITNGLRFFLPFRGRFPLPPSSSEQL